MFYFIFKIFISLIILLLIFHIFNKKEITILEIIIMLFVFNIIIFSLYNNLGILFVIISSILILLIYSLYMFLYISSLEKKALIDTVLINRGIINFHELIKENYSYEKLILNLKKKGIDNPSLVDYCIKKENDLIVFRKNSLKNYPISLIIDGKILKDNLFSINKNLDWINKKICDNNLILNDINYAYYKKNQIYFITN